MPFFRQIEAVAAVIPEQFRRHMERVRRGGRRALAQLIILCYNPDSNRGARGAPVSFSAARPRNEHGLEW